MENRQQERRSKSLFSNDEARLIKGMINDEITAFRQSVLLGDQGICAMQHGNLKLMIEKAVRDALNEYQKRIIVGVALLVTVEIVLRVFGK